MFFDGNLYKFVFVKYGQIYTQMYKKNKFSFFSRSDFLKNILINKINSTYFAYNNKIKIILLFKAHV